MSVWTHVAGIIRIDDLRFDERSPKEVIAKSLSYIPGGSEGCLDYSVNVNPDISHLAAYVISIWGDLRDYDDADEVKEWFVNWCDVLGNIFAGIRNAVITIEVEEQEPITVTYQ